MVKKIVRTTATILMIFAIAFTGTQKIHAATIISKKVLLSNTYELKVLRDDVPVRTNSSLTAQPVATMGRNTIYPVVQRLGDGWVKISINNGYGYVRLSDGAVVYEKVAKNIKVRIATSIILALFLSICFLVTLKFISSAKEHYISFGETNNSAVDTTDELKKQKEAEEKEKILKAQEQANAVRIDSEAQDEEITAKLAGTFSSYSFDVDREVTVNKKIHAFKSASWSEPGEVIEPGTKLTVDKIVSPAGYIMYHISSGDLQGQYITANEKFVSVDKKNDQLENFISRPVAIKFLTTQNIYSDESLSSVRSTYGNGAQLNITGIGISKNNRLIYHVADGSFVPVNPVRVTETNREAPKQKSNDNKNTTNSQNTQNQNTQKKTTR